MCNGFEPEEEQDEILSNWFPEQQQCFTGADFINASQESLKLMPFIKAKINSYY